MKKIIFLISLFGLGLTSNAQSLPLDFSSSDHLFAGFNGTDASLDVDPDDASNDVLKLVGGTDSWDGAAIDLTTYVDLSDDSNNTITFDMYVPASSSNSHLLKIEGGPDGATEMFFTTSGTGWQVVNVDFPAGLGDEYPKVVIFTDATSGGGNTATGTYYIDDISGTNGAVVPVDEVPTTPAPDPTAPDSEVMSIYSDTGGFNTVWSAEYSFGTLDGEPDLDATATENKAYKFDLETAGWGQGRNAVVDISAYSYLQFDYWADSNSTEFKFFMIENDGSVNETTYDIASTGGDETIVTGQWVHVQIPLSHFETSGFSKDKFFQWKIDASSNLLSKIIYFDNIYFSTSPLLSTNDITDITLKVFPNPAISNWNIRSASNIEQVEIYNTIGRRIMVLQGNGNQITIPASQLQSGNYFAQVKTEKGIGTIKLLKK